MSDDRFDGLVTAHHAEIHRYLRRVAGRSSAADDLSQETFLRAFRALDTAPEGGNVRAWLFAIATNLARNHHRSEARRRRAHAVAALEGKGQVDAAPADQPLRDELRAQVESAVARLPLRQRLAFTLRKLHDLEYEVIGEMLNCSVVTARANVFQAFKKIRLMMNHETYPPSEARR